MGPRKYVMILVMGGGLAGLPAPTPAQTRVDLSAQGRNTDFANADSTRPAKMGATLPPSCRAGEFFFSTSAAAGSNVYLCSATDTWTMQAGATTIENDGTPVATRPAQNFVPGAGMVTIISDTGTRVNVQQTVDTAVIQTQATAQSGTPLLCASSGGNSSTFACYMTPTLRAYSVGMMLQWRPDVNGSGGATTLNIDTLGAKPMKLADGVTDPTTADIVAGRLTAVWYDGANFRFQALGMMAGTTGTRPACDTSQRGRIWQVVGGAGLKDELAVCAKDAAGTYAWRLLY